MLTGDTVDGGFCSEVLDFDVLPASSSCTFSIGLVSGSGVLGDTTVFSERSVGDVEGVLEASKFLQPSGA